MRHIFAPFITLMLLLTGATALSAAADGLDWRVRVGYNIGGTAPLGVPATIRSIDAYRLTPSLFIGGDVIYSIDKGWGVMSGMYLENKGMDADVTTKGYRMEMVKDDSHIEGLFYGHVQQKVTQWTLTVPVQATYTTGSVMLKFGPYVSVLLDRDFSGIASDGYLRQGDPTGPKIAIGSVKGEWATYDFSDQINRFQFGLGAGVDWTISHGFGVCAGLNWGLTGLLKHSFKTVEQTLYPIYGTIGVFYQF